VRGHRGWMRNEIAERRAALRAKEPWQLLAIDLKNGRGGLRDLHAMHWLDAAEAITNDEALPPISEELAAAELHLIRTRNAVHALTERPSDVYRPDQANEVAAWLGGVDSLEWGRTLYAAMRLIDAAVEERLADRPSRFRLPWRRSSSTPAAPVLDSGGSDLDHLRAHLKVMGPGGSLDPLPRSAALDRLLPEWEVLRARPHIAPFHIHPVDVHVARAVSEARRIMEVDEYDSGTVRVAQEFGDPDEVLLAAFLHDIGKGHGGDHSDVGAVIAERFVTRAALPAELGLRLIAAVRLHLLLPNVATRRDIADPAVIEETAKRIGDARTLRLLYLLSIADAQASGPNVWSQWKAQLMRAFYQRLLAVLASEAPDVQAPTVEGLAEALRARFAPEAVRAHLAGMGADYLISTPSAVVGDHISLIAEAAANGGTAARHDHLGTLDRLTVVTPDRPGLIQTIAGTLAGFNANVLGGVAHTRDDGVAIEVWHVSDALGVGIDERRWDRILQALPAALRGEFNIDERLAEVRASYPAPPAADVPTLVHIDNTASRDYTILEVSTADRRGLLYGVTRLLHERGIDIHLAKVDTIGPEVVDAFYIRRANGRRIDDPDEIERLRGAVVDVLEALAS
jgi:[protein-PII] uridylyltransferase